MANSCLKGGKFSAPGFRFHPTDEELVVYYLKRKICGRKLRINAIGVVDIYKLDPSELPRLSVLKSGDRQWFFFTPRNRKYPNAARSGRCTATGYWKATGKDRVIVYNSRSVGLKKTLVFYRGRAPSGERTDWVMHEYTMDEEELGRCKNAKEYYALYKLYKKSGAGPKNGEEYGAPFQEEEWVDHDDDDDVAVPDDHVVRYENNPPPVGDGLLCNPVSIQSDDLDKLLNEIPNAPGVVAQRQMNELSGVLQGISEEDIESVLLNNPPGESLVPWDVGKALPNSHWSFQSNMRSANSFEATEVKSAFNTSGIAPLVFDKEDYIEMDDLLTPELGASSVEKPTQFSNPGEYGDFNDFDQLFREVSMSLDMEPISQEASLSSVSVNDGRQFLYQQQFQDQTFENKLNSFMDTNTNVDQFTEDMWFKDAQAYLYDQPQSYSLAPSSGVMPESTNPTMSVDGQNQGGQNVGGGTRSQFSSAMLAWMDSIPSTPASACEGPLNRTFVRMSSLSRIRFNGTSVTASKVTVAKKRIRNRGLFVLSIVGALCAIFWVFIIATVGVLGRPVLL
ncbi:NAC domain-containing protein 16 [Raphanus sativus]|uniref:NAC domain-containing protein 16 isoform X1 n=1 Tax=Raphanus sativus TaxID=3726 RepID=A0A6J0JIZ6_RAPSA|nr:NAC domain-containing protein 16 isoform X1 [Raphanus sativus]KAJ4917196.1 NAC domain-containing protein 16 [Raphanus sativus]